MRGPGSGVWGIFEIVNYRHFQDNLVLLGSMTSALASIATRSAPQYSASGSSEIIVPLISEVTCLQTLHVPSGSHELKAREINMNDMTNMILRFIRKYYLKARIVLLPFLFLFKNVVF